METNNHITYSPMIRDMAEDDRPRERLQRVGAEAVSTAELLAIVLRTGNPGESVVRLAERLLVQFRSLPGLSRATVAELTVVKGIGPRRWRLRRRWRLVGGCWLRRRRSGRVCRRRGMRRIC